MTPHPPRSPAKGRAFGVLCVSDGPDDCGRRAAGSAEGLLRILSSTGYVDATHPPLQMQGMLGSCIVDREKTLFDAAGLSASAIAAAFDAAINASRLFPEDVQQRTLNPAAQAAPFSAQTGAIAALSADAAALRANTNCSAAAPEAEGFPPPTPSCTKWTRLVLLPVLSGHVSSLSPY